MKLTTLSLIDVLKLQRNVISIKPTWMDCVQITKLQRNEINDQIVKILIPVDGS